MDDRGAGTILAVGLIASVLCALLVLAPLFSALALRARLMGAADAAALAGADVAIGIAPGSPCPVAASVARANGAAIDACRVDGVMVTVRVSAPILGFPVSAAATAGPPASRR
jgi:secretion/DNA translocation related TadE-like protein